MVASQLLVKLHWRDLPGLFQSHCCPRPLLETLKQKQEQGLLQQMSSDEKVILWSRAQLAQQPGQLQSQFTQQQEQSTQLQLQLTAALARAQPAETERTQALNLATAAQQAVALAQQAATADSTNRPLIDTKALEQPPKLKRRDLFTKLVRMKA